MIAAVAASAITPTLRSTSVALAILLEAERSAALAAHLVSHWRRHGWRRQGWRRYDFRFRWIVGPGLLNGRRTWAPLRVFPVRTVPSGKLVGKGGWIPLENDASSFFNVTTMGRRIVAGLTAALGTARRGRAKALAVEFETLTLLARASSPMTRLLSVLDRPSALWIRFVERTSRRVVPMSRRRRRRRPMVRVRRCSTSMSVMRRILIVRSRKRSRSVGKSVRRASMMRRWR